MASPIEPLVTVICVCYNHGRFVLEALNSVAAQTYKNVQLIVVDDASTDNSKDVIEGFVRSHPEVQYISHHNNVGICKAFNSAFSHARGDLVMDFSADDVLPQGRVEIGVGEFAKHDHSFGVQFGDARFIDEAGKELGLHSDKHPHHAVPQGDIYEQLIRKYFVDGPTTMVRKSVLDDLGGYDESLAYEDFDFWIRSARRYKYFYTPSVLVRQRIVRGALHERQFQAGSTHARSTLAVCRKILSLNRTRREQAALKSRLLYEMGQSLKRSDLKLAGEYFLLWKKNLSWDPPIAERGR